MWVRVPPPLLANPWGPTGVIKKDPDQPSGSFHNSFHNNYRLFFGLRLLKPTGSNPVAPDILALWSAAFIRWGRERGLYRRAAIGYDHGYAAEVFYLGLALDERYVEGWVEGCLERIGEEDTEEERLFRDLVEDETQREVVIESLKADCAVRAGRPLGH